MAARFFSITAKDPGVLLGGHGEVTLTVTNVSGRPIRGQVWLNALGETHKDWLTVIGETEKDFGVDETHSFTVQIQVPSGTVEGTYTLRPVVASFQRPNDEFDEGQMIAFQVPKAPAPEGFKWWPLIAVAAAILLVGGGVTLWLILSGSAVEIPNVVGLPVDQAMQALTDVDLSPSESGRELTASADQLPQGVESFPPAPGTVLRMEPQAGTEVEKQSRVELVLEADAKLVPDLARSSLEQAVAALQSRGLKLGGVDKVSTTDNALVGKVGKQDPAPDSRVLEGSEVAVWLCNKRDRRWNAVFSRADIAILENHRNLVRDNELLQHITPLPPNQ